MSLVQFIQTAIYFYSLPHIEYLEHASRGFCFRRGYHFLAVRNEHGSQSTDVCSGCTNVPAEPVENLTHDLEPNPTKSGTPAFCLSKTREL